MNAKNIAEFLTGAVARAALQNAKVNTKFSQARRRGILKNGENLGVNF
ncbi:MAG: hypothetical protein ACD_67C00250G0002 [uncultured bacterium]|nr:MAG: hypothetical protein ACD_67C00250G0002 [uncultured bacterium]